MGNRSGRVQLSPADLEFLKTNTHYDEETISDWYQGFMADCPGGKLSPAAFIKIYSKCFPGSHSAEFCAHVFRAFDTDQSGTIDFKEFLLAIDVTSSGTPHQKLDWAFRMYDVDGNGWVDQKEMTRIVKSILKMLGSSPGQGQKESPERQAEEIFQRLDLNSDGLVSRQEFVQACTTDSTLWALLLPNTRLYSDRATTTEYQPPSSCLSCPDCMLVEIGEKASYGDQPCEACGKYSRVPYNQY